MLSVVIPAWNEEARIGATLEAIAGYLDALRERYEILVVNDGSTDGTGRVVEAAGRREVQLLRLGENRGKGAAVRAGVLAAQGEEILFTDADLSTPIAEFAKLRAALAGGSDVAIGSRALADSEVQIHQHPIREGMGRTFNRLVRILILDGFKDTQCGFKLFRGDVGRELLGRARVDGFAFDVEILLLARSRYKVAEVPVVWRHVEQSKVSPGRDAARMLWDVVKLRWTQGWRKRS